MSKEFIFGVNHRVVVSECNGEYTVMIEATDSKILHFHAKRWSQLVDLEFNIDRKIEQCNSVKTHLGGGFFISLSPEFEFVDIRKYNFDQRSGMPQPTGHGITLKIDIEWEALKHVFHEIKQFFPRLSLVRPCSSETDHCNQEAGISCRECNPFRNEEELYLLNHSHDS